MTTDKPLIESLGAHRFVLSAQADDELVEVQIYADPAVVERIAGPAGPDERRIIAAAADFLLERQAVDELPDTVDLDALATAYDGFVDDIRARIRRA